MENVYLVIADLHLSEKNKTSRYDYQSEINHVIQNLSEIVQKYRSQNKNVISLWLGDIVDRGFRSVDKSIKAFQFLDNLCYLFDSNFVCLGNHEKTYSKGNPFWNLVNTVDSELLSSTDPRIAKGVVARGFENKVRILDSLTDGEVEFLFNHYGVGVQSPNRQKISIGLFHQDIVFREVMDDAKEKLLNVFEMTQKEMEDKYGYTYLESSPILVGYNYCFFGHNHKLYGTWKNDEGCTLQYLASLGRTNVTEVNNSFLERDIPAIIVKDGIFAGVEHNTFNLLSREQCIDENSVITNRKNYERMKDRNRYKSYKDLSDNPIENLLLNLESEECKTILLNILEDKEDLILGSLKS